MRFDRVRVVYPYSSTDTSTATKNSYFIFSEKSDFHMIDNLSIALQDFALCMLTSFSVDEILLPRYMNCSTNFRGLPLKGIALSCLKHMDPVLLAFTERLLPSLWYLFQAIQL